MLNGSGGLVSERHFVYDGKQILLQTDGDGNVTHRYLWAPVVDMILADETTDADGQTEAVHWLLGDNLNSVRDITDAAGTLLDHVDYDSFGNVRSQTDASAQSLIGFTGRPFDVNTGLQNNFHRWYDAALSQWLSEDPIGFAGGDTNLRRYVGNSPTNHVDPSGEVLPIIAGGVAAAVYFFWPNKANAPAPGDKCEPGNSHGGLFPATVASLTVGGIIPFTIGVRILIGSGGGGSGLENPPQLDPARVDDAIKDLDLSDNNGWSERCVDPTPLMGEELEDRVLEGGGLTGPFFGPIDPIGGGY